MIEIKELSVEFKGGVKAVDDFSLQVSRGSHVVIIGESGSGKSVMLSAVLGILPPKTKVSGSVYLEGEEILSLPERRIQKLRGKTIAYIPQGSGNSLNPLLKTGFQIAEPFMELNQVSFKHAMPRVLSWMKRLNLGREEKLINAYPHTLSGGMRQRVLIAMGSITGAPLLLADEPTKGLDEERVKQVTALFQEIKERTLLCVSHDLHFTEAVADYVCVMYSARLVEYCSKEEFFREPLHPYSRMMLDALPERGLHADCLFAPPHEEHETLGCHFYERCPHRTERCTKIPPLTDKNGRKVRCWLYADGST